MLRRSAPGYGPARQQGALPVRSFSAGSGAGTPLPTGGEGARGFSRHGGRLSLRCRQDAGPDCAGACGQGAGAAPRGRSGREAAGRARASESERPLALHTCPLRVHLSPHPDVLPSVCLPPAPEASQGLNPFLATVASSLLCPICSLPPSAASPSARLPVLFLYLGRQNIPDGPD